LFRVKNNNHSGVQKRNFCKKDITKNNYYNINYFHVDNKDNVDNNYEHVDKTNAVDNNNEQN